MNDKNPTTRLDQYLSRLRPDWSRTRAADLISQKQVKVNGKIATRPDRPIGPADRVNVRQLSRFSSRGADKLAGVSRQLKLNFKNKVIADIGAGAGGFCQYVLSQGPKQVIALDRGQPGFNDRLLQDPRLIYWPKTDIRTFSWPRSLPRPDLILVDLSFISLQPILAGLSQLGHQQTVYLVLLKPQFENNGLFQLNRGLVANQRQRRQIIKRAEAGFRAQGWLIKAKADCPIAGKQGNRERFYLLKPPPGPDQTLNRKLTTSLSPRR